MRLRPAAAADAPALAVILGDWVRETGWMPVLHGREEDAGFLAHLIATTEVTVAEDDRAVLGFLALDGEEVRALYLAPEGRGRGVGRALLDAAKEGAAKEGPAKGGRARLEAWAFQANAWALAFYAREGFREVARTDGDNEEGLPDVRLVWEGP